MNFKIDDTRELHELLSALVDDMITDEQFVRLDQLMANDARARELFIRYVDLHNELLEGDALAELVAASHAEAKPDADANQRNGATKEQDASTKQHGCLKTERNLAALVSGTSAAAVKSATESTTDPAAAAASKTHARATPPPPPVQSRVAVKQARSSKESKSPAANADAHVKEHNSPAKKPTARKKSPEPPKKPIVAAAPPRKHQPSVATSDSKKKPSRQPATAQRSSQRDTPQPPPVKKKDGQPAAALVAAAPAVDLPKSADDEQQPRAVRRMFMRVPAWAISTFVHAAALILLALATFSIHEEIDELAIVSSSETEEPLEEMEFEITPVELQELDINAIALADPGAADFGEITLATDAAASATDVGDLLDSPVGDVGLLFGDDGLGMSEIGGGKGAAMFFGVKVSGNRFCYVVDNSNSMTGGKFETAVYELTNSVRALSKEQYFYVIFYSDTAYPLFYPETANGWVRATDENKQKLEYWLMTVHRCLRTNGEEAMALAFSLRPDAIYMLGDGAFGDKTVEKTLAVNNSDITIHTLGFNMRPQDVEGFRTIAEKFGGKFTDVKVTPAMVELSKRINRPKNNSQNGVWGIKLGKK